MPRTSDARDRIVATAARLFLERSYQAVGVDELCQAADVRKGSFYHYFSSKSELAKAVIDLHADLFARRLSGSTAATPAQTLHAIPDAIGAIRPRWKHSSGARSAAPSATSPPNCRPPTTIYASTSPTNSPPWRVTSLWHATTPPRPARFATAPTRTVSPTHSLAQYQGIILLAKLNDSGVEALAPALHDFIDGYLVDGSMT